MARGCGDCRSLARLDSSHIEVSVALGSADQSHSRLASSRGITTEQRETAAKAFCQVRELHLGACALTWSEAVAIGALFPSLETLFLNDNPIALRAEASAAAEVFRHLQLLSLDGCGVGSWEDAAEALLPLPL